MLIEVGYKLHNGNNWLCILFNEYFTDNSLGSRAPETYHASDPGRIMLFPEI